MLSAFLLSLDGTQWGEKTTNKSEGRDTEWQTAIWTWFKPATLQIHDTHVSRLNYEDTLSHFCCILRCLSRPVFVINLTLSFPLSQHFLRSILPRLAARREEGKTHECALNFDKGCHPRPRTSKILGQSCVKWKDGRQKSLYKNQWKQRQRIQSLTFWEIWCTGCFAES